MKRFKLDLSYNKLILGVIAVIFVLVIINVLLTDRSVQNQQTPVEIPQGDNIPTPPPEASDRLKSIKVLQDHLPFVGRNCSIVLEQVSYDSKPKLVIILVGNANVNECGANVFLYQYRDYLQFVTVEERKTV